ncbi:hypothetical protein LTS18_000429, partial [Coniosporium uncinatum]
FDVHDDEEGSGQNGANSGEGDADIDHTTSFAKPKTLDPKSISTQTVTGIDPPDKPYAVFTFLYRGEKQLQKMGILQAPSPEPQAPTTARRKSRQIDFSSLKPLESQGAKGIKNFAGYRDPAASTPVRRKSKQKDEDAMDSDADDEDETNVSKEVEDDVDIKQEDPNLLSPDDARRQGELAEGVRKIKLKRQHSVEPVGGPSLSPAERKASGTSSPVASTTQPPSENGSTVIAGPVISSLPADIPLEALVGSPFKKQRASLPGGLEESVKRSLNSELMSSLGGSEGRGPAEAVHSGVKTNTSSTEGTASQSSSAWPTITQEDEDEEL